MVMTRSCTWPSPDRVIARLRRAGLLSERTSVDVGRRNYSLSPAKGSPMIVSNNDILWSASDLTRAAECEFALLRQLDVKLGRIPAPEAAADPLMDRIAEIGLEHEARELTRSEEHTSELQSLMRISYAVFCLKKKNILNTNTKLIYNIP